MLRKLSVLAVSACIGLMVGAGPAGAASGTETFRLIYTSPPGPGAPGRAVATGVVNGVGTDLTTASQVNPDGTTSGTHLVTLPGGTITLHNTDPANIFSFDPATCVGRILGSGPYTVGGGTGAYSGATGGGTFTAVGVIVFEHLGGACGRPVAFVNVITATGPLSVP